MLRVYVSLRLMLRSPDLLKVSFYFLPWQLTITSLFENIFFVFFMRFSYQLKLITNPRKLRKPILSEPFFLVPSLFKINFKGFTGECYQGVRLQVEFCSVREATTTPSWSIHVMNWPLSKWDQYLWRFVYFPKNHWTLLYRRTWTCIQQEGSGISSSHQFWDPMILRVFIIFFAGWRRHELGEGDFLLGGMPKNPRFFKKFFSSFLEYEYRNKIHM